MFPGSFYFVLLSEYGLSSMHQTMVCRRDGHNSMIARVLQAIRPVLLLSDDLKSGFPFSPGSSFRFEGGRGLWGIGAPGRNPASSQNYKKSLILNISINLINTLTLKNFKNIKKPYSYYIYIYYIRAHARYYLSIKYKYLLE